MAQRMESLEDIMPESRQYDILREGIMCFLVGKTIVPVRLCSPPPESFGKESAYYYSVCS